MCVCVCAHPCTCRTRKAAADATSDLAAKQVTLNELSSQLSSKQLQLEGVEASLAAKSRELADVLAQLQAAAAQEFQDAKKLLLEEGLCLMQMESPLGIIVQVGEGGALTMPSLVTDILPTHAPMRHTACGVICACLLLLAAAAAAAANLPLLLLLNRGAAPGQ